MKRFFVKIYNGFIKIRGTPKQISLGFALGLFIGMSPTMGIQIVIAIFFASLLRWNKITATIGVQITNPLTAPFIYGLTYLVGSKVMGLHKEFVFKDIFKIQSIAEMIDKVPHIFLALTLGGIIVGLPLGVIGYFISFKIVDRYQQRVKDLLLLKKEKIAQRVRKKIKAKQKKKSEKHNSGE